MAHCNVKTIERRLLRIGEATIYAAISKTTLYAEIKAGRLKLVKLGHASRIEVSALDNWIDETAKRA
jgi:excisionase family DNA binding protein